MGRSRAVPLGNWKIDELVAIGQDTCQRRPAAVEHSPTSPRSKTGAATTDRAARRRAAEIVRAGRRGLPDRSRRGSSAECRRGEPESRTARLAQVAAQAGRHRDSAKLRDDQRNAQRRLVREQSVRLLAVVAQRFAVIAGDDDKRRPRRRPHLVQQRRQRGVGCGNLAVVGRVAYCASKGGGGR